MPHILSDIIVWVWGVLPRSKIYLSRAGVIQHTTLELPHSIASKMWTPSEASMVSASPPRLWITLLLRKTGAQLICFPLIFEYMDCNAGHVSVYMFRPQLIQPRIHCHSMRGQHQFCKVSMNWHTTLVSSLLDMSDIEMIMSCVFMCRLMMLRVCLKSCFFFAWGRLSSS